MMGDAIKQSWACRFGITLVPVLEFLKPKIPHRYQTLFASRLRPVGDRGRYNGQTL
ncbi:MAG: hypothetical protein GY927_17150 [bacterium]|nr:hypothetical protein [bacterium]